MKSADRKKLEKLALERLDATANDEERWSFLFRTDGAGRLTYCPWSETEDWEFDGETENLGLPWSQARIEFIKGGGDPNEEELRQWREAKCRQLADGSDWCWIAWMSGSNKELPGTPFLYPPRTVALMIARSSKVFLIALSNVCASSKLKALLPISLCRPRAYWGWSRPAWGWGIPPGNDWPDRVSRWPPNHGFNEGRSTHLIYVGRIGLLGFVLLLFMLALFGGIFLLARTLVAP